MDPTDISSVSSCAPSALSLNSVHHSGKVITSIERTRKLSILLKNHKTLVSSIISYLCVISVFFFKSLKEIAFDCGFAL